MIHILLFNLLLLLLQNIKILIVNYTLINKSELCQCTYIIVYVKQEQQNVFNIGKYYHSQTATLTCRYVLKTLLI